MIRRILAVQCLVIVLLCLVAWALFLSMMASRPPAPPLDSRVVNSWGSMNLDGDGDELSSDLQRSIAASIECERERQFDPDGDGHREYALLVLSGGGSLGAFGAGLLSGWSESGTRPDFKIVTGVSTGSLQATFAFLGSDYDDELTEVFTQYDTDQIYTKRGFVGAVLGESTWDSAPLKALIDRYITADVLSAVAAKHALGYRLFVGTANMDTGKFTIWDMGAIASSSRPERLARYRNVLLASSAIPVLFPPVYFDVEMDGETFYEMHVDGGAQAQLFLRGFMLGCKESLRRLRLLGNAEVSIYIIRNGLAGTEDVRATVNPSSIAIASATINGVFDLSMHASLFRVYVLAKRYGIDFNLAMIPDHTFDGLDSVIFDLKTMRELKACTWFAAIHASVLRKPAGRLAATTHRRPIISKIKLFFPSSGARRNQRVRTNCP